MSSKLLKDTGEALYGPSWQSDIARDLGVSDRTVRRWASGANDPPSGVALDLWRLAIERADDLERLCERLKVASTPG